MLLCGDRNHQGIRKRLLPILQKREHLLLVADVDLVDGDHHRTVQFPELFNIFGILVALLDHIGDIEDDVGIAYGGVHEFHHVLLQPVGRLEHARRVGIHNLVIVCVDDAHYPVPGSLGFCRHD